MAECDLTAEYVRSLLDYDPETGVFRWKQRPREHYASDHLWKRAKTRWAGTIAGYIDDGYRKITIDGRDYRAHRIAWLITHGEWPPFLVDHKNGNRDDNRLCNLREATSFQNGQNRVVNRNKSLPIKGVYLDHNRYRAMIRANGVSVHLGCFGSVEEAAAAYKAAAVNLHGEFANFGGPSS